MSMTPEDIAMVMNAINGGTTSPVTSTPTTSPVVPSPVSPEPVPVLSEPAAQVPARVDSTTKAQKAADRIVVNEVKRRVMANQQVTSLDVLTLLLSSPNEAQIALDTAINGGGYTQLRLAGLVDKEALVTLAVVNMNIDTQKYEAETALQKVLSSIECVQSFMAWLATKSLALTSMSNIEQQIRDNVAIYAELKGWQTVHG